MQHFPVMLFVLSRFINREHAEVTNTGLFHCTESRHELCFNATDMHRFYRYKITQIDLIANQTMVLWDADANKQDVELTHWHRAHISGKMRAPCWEGGLDLEISQSSVPVKSTDPPVDGKVRYLRTYSGHCVSISLLGCFFLFVVVVFFVFLNKNNQNPPQASLKTLSRNFANFRQMFLKRYFKMSIQIR